MLIMLFFVFGKTSFLRNERICSVRTFCWTDTNLWVCFCVFDIFLTFISTFRIWLHSWLIRSISFNLYLSIDSFYDVVPMFTLFVSLRVFFQEIFIKVIVLFIRFVFLSFLNLLIDIIKLILQCKHFIPSFYLSLQDYTG